MITIHRNYHNIVTLYRNKYSNKNWFFSLTTNKFRFSKCGFTQIWIVSVINLANDIITYTDYFLLISFLITHYNLQIYSETSPVTKRWKLLAKFDVNHQNFWWLIIYWQDTVWVVRITTNNILINSYTISLLLSRHLCNVNPVRAWLNRLLQTTMSRSTRFVPKIPLTCARVNMYTCFLERMYERMPF